MTIDENILNKLIVPEKLKSVLEESYGTVDEVRQFLKQIYEDNQSPKQADLLRLEKKLILENFNIKKQSDIYYQDLKYYQEKFISNRTLDINKSLYKEEYSIKLNKNIQELNELSKSSMGLIGQIPDLQLEFVKDITNYDKLDIESLYSRDKILEKIAHLDSTIENTEYDDTFKKDLKNLQEIIQQEKLQRFRLYILNKSLYTNRYKKLKELDSKWSTRLDEMIKMESTISKFNEKLNGIKDNDTEKEEDDMILLGLDNNDDDDDEEEEEEEVHISEEEEEEEDIHDEEEQDKQDEVEEQSYTEEEEEEEESKKRSVEQEQEQEQDLKRQKKEDEMEIDEQQQDNDHLSDLDDIELEK